MLLKMLALSCIPVSAMAATVESLNCGSCAEWNKPQAPFKLVGNAYYVGTGGLSSVLITGPQGHILLDGALPQSAPLIEANIKALGFRVQDIKYILNSHAHWDHAGGIAALQRASGAQVAASASGAQVLRDGTIGKDDPQYDAKDVVHITPIANVKVVADGDVIRVGDLAVTAHLTPGHTPGSTTWTWQSCEAGKCYNMVYADSLTPVSNDTFRFTPQAASFKATIAKLGALPCDVVVSTHPGFTDTFEKLAKRTDKINTFIDPAGCRAYAAGASKNFAARLAKEAAH